MDLEKIKRLKSLKVIISEAIMVLIVVVTVIILALVVSGYWVNSDFEVERQGMLQVSSIPTGASVAIDGETSWRQRTNTSKVLASGEHTVTLTKEDYDSWSKTINITEGLLYRLHYPRLFLKERTPEEYYYLPESIYATVSPEYDLLLIVNNTTNWLLINLTEESPKPRTIDISSLFRSAEPTSDQASGLFAGNILTASWDHDEAHVLCKVQMDSRIEWLLLDVRNPQKSINITREFGSDFSDIQILDNSANNLLVVQNGNLHKIDVPDKSLSAVLIEKIADYYISDNEIVFVSEQLNDVQTMSYEIGVTKIGDKTKTSLFQTTGPVKVAQIQFYDKKYLAVLEGNTITLYDRENLEETIDYITSFNPDNMEIGHHGDFILLSSGAHLAAIDMEAGDVFEWIADNDGYDWLDHDMLYDVDNGNLFVYDYDGLNRRHLAENVSSHFPVTITDNKWLYYFSDDYLVREWIVKH